MSIISKVRHKTKPSQYAVRGATGVYALGRTTGSFSISDFVTVTNPSKKVLSFSIVAKLSVAFNYAVASSSDVLMLSVNMFCILEKGSVQVSEAYCQGSAVAISPSPSVERDPYIPCSLEQQALKVSVPPNSAIKLDLTAGHILPIKVQHPTAATLNAVTTGQWYDTSAYIVQLSGVADEGLIFQQLDNV